MKIDINNKLGTPKICVGFTAFKKMGGGVIDITVTNPSFRHSDFNCISKITKNEYNIQIKLYEVRHETHSFTSQSDDYHDVIRYGHKFADNKVVEERIEEEIAEIIITFDSTEKALLQSFLILEQTEKEAGANFVKEYFLIPQEVCEKDFTKLLMFVQNY
jgi:hypothetical protein